MSGTAILLVLFIAGAAATAAGVVVLLRASETRAKAIGAALVAAGAVSLLVVVFATPVSASGTVPAPEIEVHSQP